MSNPMQTDQNDIMGPPVKLFEGERWLVITSLLGFILATGIAIFIFFRGPIILPEGDLKNAFSFNAAIGIFLLSIAAVLPFARLEARKRKRIRWFFIIAVISSYTIETVQNFRGFNPRFSREGEVADIIAGMLFGVFSILFVILAILLTVQFFRMKYPYERPMLIIGIRYAFLAVLISNFVGIWMVMLQGRITGDAGNLIVLHGIGFHALQALILPGWLLEKVRVNVRIKKLLIHNGSMAWMFSIILIGVQTALGRSVFELTVLPILTSILLFMWLGTLIVSSVLFIKKRGTNTLSTDRFTPIE